MGIQELLGWAQSVINSMGLADVVRAAFVIALAYTAIRGFAGLRRE